MNERYFILVSSSRFEKKRKYHLISPKAMSQEEFNSLVEMLSKTAARNVMEVVGRKLIGWTEIVEEIANLLVTNCGFTLIHPKKYEFKNEMGWINNHYPLSDSDKILGEVLNEVIQHNDVTTWDCHHQAVS